MCLHNTRITFHLQKNYETEEKPNPRRTGIYMEEWGSGHGEGKLLLP